jgi:hypothetical protein
MEKQLQSVCLALVALFLAFSAPALSSADETVRVTVDNFVRAETAFQFDRMVDMTGGVNQWHHNRGPTPLDQQNVIRMNRDTLYSSAVVDISKGATLTIPDSGERYLSLMVVNEDEYINKVYHEGGTYELTMEEFDTPYVNLSARILADPNDPNDLKIANALQDQLKIEAVSAQPYSHPIYDEKSYQAVYKAVLDLAAAGIPNANNMFGKKNEVDAVRHFIGAGFGWGGLPTYEAFYETHNETRPVGRYELTVKDVPVDAFWSISIYNKDGFFERNKYDSYSINSVTAKPNEDGSITVNFAPSQDGQDNFLYIMDGWNYTVRLYQPSEEIQDGKWTFPEPKAVK